MKISNKRREEVLKRTLVALLVLLLVAAGPAGYSIRYEPRHFAGCEAAAAFAGAHRTVGLYQYRLWAHFVHVTVSRVPGLGYRANARIRYAFVPGSTVMLLPKWTWPNATPAQKEALGAFMTALHNHEDGHAEIAERGIAGRESAITVLAASRAEVKKQLELTLTRQLRALYDEVLAMQKTYDRVTDHGIRQADGPLYGFRGGGDVVFSCR